MFTPGDETSGDGSVIFGHDTRMMKFRRKALEGGALVFTYKPFEPGALLTAVNQAMSNCSNVRTIEVQEKKN